MPTVEERVAQAGLLVDAACSERRVVQQGLLVDAWYYQPNVAFVGLMVDAYHEEPRSPGGRFPATAPTLGRFGSL